jgi:hypothetical protein
MKGLNGRNVTQMASLLQNLVESQLFGDGVTGEAASGDIELDSDIAKALKTIKELLLGDIQRALKREHSVDQTSVNKLHECWDRCSSAHDADQEQVDEMWGVVQSWKKEHETCREDVHATYVDKIIKCNELDIWIDNIKCPDCYKEECVSVHDPDDHKVGNMLQAHLTWATNSFAEWSVKHAACAKAVRANEDADARCDRTQGEFETGSCAYRQAVWTACNVNQMACCKKCSTDFAAEVNRVECAEKDRKIDWSATEKIECYIDVLMASPTDDELAAKCKADGKACINQWREDKYKSCENRCADVDFEGGSYSVVDGVNTTHRTDSTHGDRCTLHLDINFPMEGSCEKCPPPIPGPCEEFWISTNYDEYDSNLPVPGLEDENECRPDQHQKWWAYSRAECRPCPSLVGKETPKIIVCPGPRVPVPEVPVPEVPVPEVPVPEVPVPEVPVPKVPVPEVPVPEAEVPEPEVPEPKGPKKWDGAGWTGVGVGRTAECRVWGDPHITTFDGFQTTHFQDTGNLDSYKHGDFWLVNAADIKIQGRYWSDDGSAKTSLRALAISGSSMNDKTLIIEPQGWWGMTGQISWRGQSITSAAMFNGAKREGSFSSSGDHTSAQLRITTSSKVTLMVSRAANYIDVSIAMQQRPLQSGHCGNFNGDDADDRLELQHSKNLVSESEVLFYVPTFGSSSCPASLRWNQLIRVTGGGHIAVDACAKACHAHNGVNVWTHFGVRSGTCYCAMEHGHGEAGWHDKCYSYHFKNRAQTMADCPHDVQTRARHSCAAAMPHASAAELDACVFDSCFADADMVQGDIDFANQKEQCTGVKPNQKGVTAEHCKKCAEGYKWWPCDDAALRALCC